VAEVKRYSLVKPTMNTPFHIDFDWWSQNDREWRIHLRNCLCSEHQQAFADIDDSQKVDFVDPETAEVQRVDGLQHILISHCSQVEGFITNHTSLVESIFRLFLANGNLHMTSLELAERLNRPSTTILRLVSGVKVYNGIRPCPECKDN
jgi:hypothetical protein